MQLQQHQETAERAISYAIGTGGVLFGGLTWAGVVQFASDLTVIVGLFTAVFGCAVVGLRLYRDVKRGK